VGVDTAADACTVVLFDTAPTTVEQLTTNSTYRFPCADIALGSESAIAAYNLAHPDHLLKAPTQMPYACASDGSGKFRLRDELANTLDIEIDAALETGGKVLSGSLTVPAGPNLSGSIVRNLRLTRVQ
jgi:hypothetical protein